MNADEKGYNGWTNRATWAVALHVNNDQGWQDAVFELVRGLLVCPECSEPIRPTADAGTPWVHTEGGNAFCDVADHDAGSADEADPMSDVADAIEAQVTSIVDPLAYIEEFGDTELSVWANGPGLAARDIGDLDDVDWRDLAESFIRDATEV